MKLPAGSLGTYILIVTKSTFVTAIIRCRGERFFSFMLSQRSIPSYVERNGFCDGGRHLLYSRYSIQKSKSEHEFDRFDATYDLGL